MTRGLSILCWSAALCALAPAQTPTGFIDVYQVKVKPEKRADFDAIAKKMAVANRKFKGDTWLAYGTEYGEANTVAFASVREKYADIDHGSEMFMSALKESLGPTFMKIFQDMNNCTLSARGELRRRRQDLSWSLPSDQAELMKFIGESRWMRIFTVRVRPGRNMEYEEKVLKPVKAAYEKSSMRRPTFISVSAAGQPSGVYYSTNFFKAFADWDPSADQQTLQQLMGEQTYTDFMHTVGELTLSSEVSFARLLPELSNPPAEIAKAAPDFWTPKPAAAPKPKPKAPEAAKPGQ